MRRDKVVIYLHLIWTTWDREPFITTEIEPEIYDIIGAMVARHDARVLKIGGVADHVHLLIQIASTTRLCDLVKDAKGASSHFAAQRMGAFRWRPTYAAFSVSRWNKAGLMDYIARQKEHHANGTLDLRLEDDGE